MQQRLIKPFDAPDRRQGELAKKGIVMRLIIAIIAVVSLQAFAADAPQAEQAAPKCYNGDDSKFYSVGEKATISGVAVVCEATADKKNAQWMSDKDSK